MTLADGTRRLAPYVGPLLVTVANRKGRAGAMVLGTEVLLGVITVEELVLVVVLGTRQVIPNPPNPNVAASIAKGVRR